MMLNIAAVIVAIAMIVLVVVLIPLIMELRRTATAVREFVESMEAELKPTIAEMNRTLADLQILTGGASEKVEDIKCFMSAVGETGRGLRTISTVVSGAAGALTRSSLWLTGAKVAGSFMMDKLIKKRG
ncbi:MAG TPA: DUF948 domain-containing protein [Geobacteraceae bacterium]|nr:DUF948 domain-containing protein [Geobacteraceae bacterium]